MSTKLSRRIVTGTTPDAPATPSVTIVPRVNAIAQDARAVLAREIERLAERSATSGLNSTEMRSMSLMIESLQRLVKIEASTQSESDLADLTDAELRQRIKRLLSDA